MKMDYFSKSCFQISVFDKGQIQWLQARKRKLQERLSKSLEEVVHNCSTEKIF